MRAFPLVVLTLALASLPAMAQVAPASQQPTPQATMAEDCVVAAGSDIQAASACAPKTGDAVAETPPAASVPAPTPDTPQATIEATQAGNAAPTTAGDTPAQAPASGNAAAQPPTQAEHVAHGARAEQRQLDVARALPAPCAQRLPEILVAIRQGGIGGGVEDAADAERGVEHEASQRLPRLLGLALQQRVERGHRLAEIGEEVAHAQPHRPRHHRHVGVGQWLGDAAVDRVVEAVHLAVEAFPRVVAVLHFGRRRQGGIGDRVVVLGAVQRGVIELGLRGLLRGCVAGSRRLCSRVFG
jgi:hypothetical protein